MSVLKKRGYDAALRDYLAADKPYLGICLGMQTLFESSEETNESGHKVTGSPLPGLGVIPGKVIKFDESTRSVPHIGWNGVIAHQHSPAMRYMNTNDTNNEEEEVYFVHSYYAPITEENKQWVLTRTTYEGQEYISSVQRGNVVATQFHPEKSGKTGLHFIQGFLEVRERERKMTPKVVPDIYIYLHMYICSWFLCWVTSLLAHFYISNPFISCYIISTIHSLR